ncbi:hypothetical protein ACFGVR_10525 [Mucilaginibacter sp. AW1-3]
MFTEETLPNTPIKKTWADPRLFIISRNDILTPKSKPNVHESTGKYTANASYGYFSNQAGTSRVVLTKNGNPIGNVSSAAS